MRIGELAKQAGVKPVTVRFYERRHLLPPPERRESGYRDYNRHDLQRLLFIRRAKTLGFSLEEIALLLGQRDQGVSVCAEVEELTARHVKQLDQQIAALQQLRGRLQKTLATWRRRKPNCASSVDVICSLIEQTPVP
jgi:MerR family Zn(II)-responsive transcriptional regulator of zntA